MIASWPSPSGGDEFALAFDRQRTHRLLIIPALFDEANKTRHLAVETMRRLDAAGIDSFLPDLPGCNESLVPLESQSMVSWQEAASAAAMHFAVTHVLAIRAGAILVPENVPGWRYAPIGGAAALRALVRARVIGSHELGRDETADKLHALGREQGIDLAGYRPGADMIRELEASGIPESGGLSEIDQAMVGGSAPWLRAEPGLDPAQADALAAIVSVGLAQ